MKVSLDMQSFDMASLPEVVREKQREKKAEGRSCVIAIDGPCASGKTTLAERLAAATGAGIVHMDDFFLPVELRTKERLGEPGGNVHYERFLEEVIPALLRGGDFAYRRFDCGRMEMGEWRQIRAAEAVIVEGSYSCHPKLGDYMDLRIFLEIDGKLQRERILRREGKEAAERFWKRWIPMEELYLETYRIRERADILMRAQ